jgi:hypothetical protein
MRHGQVRELDRLHPGVWVRILESIKVLHQTNDGVASLGERILF